MPESELVPVADIIIGRRVRKDPRANLMLLRESIRQLGLLQPVVLNSRNELVAGSRRLEAVKELGWNQVPARRIATLDDALAAVVAERDENTCRSGMTMSELVELGQMIEALERPKAQARVGGRPRKGKETSGNLPEVSTGQTRDKVAAALDMSGKTYEKAKVVVEAAEREPDRFSEIAAEMDRTGKVDPAFREVKKQTATPTPAAEQRPVPTVQTAPSLREVVTLLLSRATESGDGFLIQATVEEVRLLRNLTNC